MCSLKKSTMSTKKECLAFWFSIFYWFATALGIPIGIGIIIAYSGKPVTDPSQLSGGEAGIAGGVVIFFIILFSNLDFGYEYFSKKLGLSED